MRCYVLQMKKLIFSKVKQLAKSSTQDVVGTGDKNSIRNISKEEASQLFYIMPVKLYEGLKLKR